MVSVPLFALEACMAARRVQTGFVPAVAHTLLVGLELATSAVLFTTKVCTAPQAGTPPPKRKAAPTRAEGSIHALAGVSSGPPPGCSASGRQPGMMVTTVKICERT